MLQDVAVVGGVRADDVPQQERRRSPTTSVGGERAPARRESAGASGGRRAGRGATARPARRWSTTIASTIAASFKVVGVVENRVSMVGRQRQPRRRRPGQVGEHADDLRAQVRVGEAAALSACPSRIGQPDERGERARLRRGDLDALTLRRRHLVPRHARDHHVAVGDVDALAVDVDEQRVERGLLAVLRAPCPAPRRPAAASTRITSHGTVTVIVTGACEISGAVTLFSWPFCGQFSVAVVCTTGSSGVATDSTKPIRPGDRRHPARHVATSRSRGRGLPSARFVVRHAVMAGP